MIAMPDATALALMQRLPTSARRQLVERLAEFGPPAEWKDDAVFYDWLAGHYRQFGAAHVDAALRAMGGNSAKRTLRQCAIEWALDQGFRLDSDLALKPQIADLDDSNPLVRSLAEVASLLEGGAKAQQAEEVEDAQGTMLAPETDDGFDAGSVIATAEGALRRIDPALVPDEMLLFVKQFAEELSGRIEAFEREQARAKERATAAQALALLHEALASLPPEHALEVPRDIDGAQIGQIEMAIAAVKCLATAAQAESQASLQLKASRSFEERKKALQESMHALEVVESAVQDAREKLAMLGGGDGPAPEDEARDEDEAVPAQEQGPPDGDPTIDASAEPAGCEADAVAVEPAPARECHECHEEDGSESDDSEEPDCSAIRHDADKLEPATIIEQPTTGLGGPAVVADPVPIAAPFAESEPGTEASEHEPDLLAAPDVMGDWDCWVHLALSQDRLGLAVHLARARELAGANRQDSWPSVLLEGLMFGMSVEAGNDRAAGRYETLSTQLIEIAS